MSNNPNAIIKSLTDHHSAPVLLAALINHNDSPEKLKTSIHEALSDFNIAETPEYFASVLGVPLTTSEKGFNDGIESIRILEELNKSEWSRVKSQVDQLAKYLNHDSDKCLCLAHFLTALGIQNTPQVTLDLLRLSNAHLYTWINNENEGWDETEDADGNESSQESDEEAAPRVRSNVLRVGLRDDEKIDAQVKPLLDNLIAAGEFDQWFIDKLILLLDLIEKEVARKDTDARDALTRMQDYCYANSMKASDDFDAYKASLLSSESSIMETIETMGEKSAKTNNEETIVSAEESVEELADLIEHVRWHKKLPESMKEPLDVALNNIYNDLGPTTKPKIEYASPHLADLLKAELETEKEDY